MLDVCYTYCQEWDLKFNVKKSNVMIVGKSDGAVMPPTHLGTELLCWVSEMKYLGVILYSKGGLRVNVHVNCMKFLGSSFSILQSCRGFNEQVLCEIILTKCLPILMYGLESFRLLAAERDKVKMAFNCVIRRIFKLSKFTSVRHIIHMIGSKPGNILIDERRCLLLLSCSRDECTVVRNVASVLACCDDFNRIFITYNVSSVYCSYEVKHNFSDFMNIYVMA